MLNEVKYPSLMHNPIQTFTNFKLESVFEFGA